MCESLNNFFKEGNYKFTVIIEPSCTFPDGNMRNGSANVKKIYSCKNPKKLLSVVIGGKNNLALSAQSFIEDGSWIYSTSLGTAYAGIVKNIKKVCNNKIIICGKGYSESVGENIKLKIITSKTDVGFTEYFYYLKNKRYELFAKRIFEKEV